jgi:ribokinase
MIVVFGSVNLDLIFQLPHIPRAGETVLGPHLRQEPGGKGANQALAAARDGARVIMAGAVGRDALADTALQLLRQQGVDLSRVVATDLSTGCAGIAVDPNGDNAICVGSGANLLAKSDQVEDALLGPDTTLVLQMEVSTAETEALIDRAHRCGARVILNLAPAAALSAAALRALDILVINDAEAAWLGSRLQTGATTQAIQASLGITVIRTLGSKGVEATTADGVHLRLPAREIVPVDTTAAGDCFMGVLAASLDRGETLKQALTRANTAAGLCCTRAGSQTSIPTRAETDAALQATD